MRVKDEDFKEEHLRHCPVWASDDSNDYLVPVPHYEPLPTDLGDLVIRARFTSADGRHFEGSIYVGYPPPSAVSLDVCGAESISFNKAAPSEFTAKEFKRLLDLLGVEPFPVFPLRYETDFHYPGQPNIAGLFEIESG